MITGIPLSVTYSRIAAFNKINENRLGDSLLNMASGKKVRQPKDGVVEYFRAERFNRESVEYSGIRSGIAKASAMMNVVVDAGEMVYNGLNRMRQLVDLYHDDITTQDEKSAIEAEFSSLVKQVSHIINNTTYDGRQVISDSSADPLDSVMISPAGAGKTIDIFFRPEQVADVSLLKIGTTREADGGAVQAELDKAGYFLANASAFVHGLNAHYAIADRKVNISSTLKNVISGTDDGMEMIRAVNQSIRHQSSFAMLAQANLLRNSVAQLFQV